MGPRRDRGSESPGRDPRAMRGRSASLTFASLSLSSLLAIVLLPERSSFSSSSSLSRSFLFFSRRSAASSSTTSSSSSPSCLSLLANRSTFSSARPSRRGSPSPFCCRVEHDGRKKWRRYGHSSAISARCRVFDEVRVFFLFLFVPNSNSRVAAPPSKNRQDETAGRSLRSSTTYSSCELPLLRCSVRREKINIIS